MDRKTFDGFTPLYEREDGIDIAMAKQKKLN